MPWQRIHKGDTRGREMADLHYTRQTPGHPMWTRPGYNHCLLAEFPQGRALFVWWRPKWEDGRPGTSRKDGLRVIECTIFRIEGVTPLASELIHGAVEALAQWEACEDLKLDCAGAVEGLITGVGASQTVRRRSRRSQPGVCFQHAGWERFDKRAGKADVWYRLSWENCW